MVITWDGGRRGEKQGKRESVCVCGGGGQGAETVNKSRGEETSYQPSTHFAHINYYTDAPGISGVESCSPPNLASLRIGSLPPHKTHAVSTEVADPEG